MKSKVWWGDKVLLTLHASLPLFAPSASEPGLSSHPLHIPDLHLFKGSVNLPILLCVLGE